MRNCTKLKAEKENNLKSPLLFDFGKLLIFYLYPDTLSLESTNKVNSKTRKFLVGPLVLHGSEQGMSYRALSPRAKFEVRIFHYLTQE